MPLISHKFATELIKELPKTLIPVGSYSRRIDRFPGLDFVTLTPLREVFVEIVKNFTVSNILSIGEKFMSVNVLFKDHTVKIDVWKSTNENLIFAKFALESPREYVVKSRTRAKRLGYKLTETGLFDASSNERLPIINTQQIFEQLGLTAREPWER